MEPIVVIEQVKEKVEHQIETKLEEIVPKVEEKVVELTTVALDKTQDVVSDATQKVTDVVTKAVESSAVVQKVEALVESNPQVKAAVEKLESMLVKEVDGRMFTCWCFWWWSLKITRQDPRKLPAKASPSTDTALPLPSTQVPEWSPPTAPAAGEQLTLS